MVLENAVNIDRMATQITVNSSAKARCWNRIKNAKISKIRETFKSIIKLRFFHSPSAFLSKELR
jgi:hypothetical protein